MQCRVDTVTRSLRLPGNWAESETCAIVETQPLGDRGRAGTASVHTDTFLAAAAAGGVASVASTQGEAP